jgi:hypothetical protein
MIHADQWEELITSSLPYLKDFKFDFYCSHVENALIEVKKFQTNFWQKQHHWFIDYVVYKNEVLIYTKNHRPNPYRLIQLDDHVYLTDNDQTCNDVTNLIVYQEQLTKNCDSYFPNVRSLTLTTLIKSESLTLEHMKYLNQSVNLFTVKNLNISTNISSSALLEILKNASQLSSLTIQWNQLTSMFNDHELCEYLNRMIKRLDVNGGTDDLFDSLVEAKEFCKIFSNIEHLQWENGHEKHFLFLLNRLPKLSTLDIQWKTTNNPKNYLSQFERHVKKQNLIYDINVKGTHICPCPNCGDTGNDYHRLESVNGPYEIKILLWFGNNIIH